MPLGGRVEQSGGGLWVCTEDKYSGRSYKERLVDVESQRKNPESQRRLRTPIQTYLDGWFFVYVRVSNGHKFSSYSSVFVFT